jgi:curli biogenesis system outer membrane secretion channel CsgG
MVEKKLDSPAPCASLPWGTGVLVMRMLLLLAAALAVASSPNAQPKALNDAVGPSSAPQGHLALKRKLAVGRFTNSTRYGKALLFDADKDPLANQAADMLMARLVDTGEFVVFERNDIDSISREQGIAGSGRLVGVDTLLVGSITEFGRKVEGKAGFLNSQMRQVASATVEVRLIDVATGQAFFSTSGAGSASVQAGEVAGFGSRAGYDSTLNDKAISAAISDLMTNVLQRLHARRWSTDVLQVRGDQVFLSGGPSQGLKVGDQLALEVRGETIVSGQTGLPLTLPGQGVGRLEIVSFFGEGPQQEGAIARVVQGRTPSGDLKAFQVVEPR